MNPQRRKKLIEAWRNMEMAEGVIKKVLRVLFQVDLSQLRRSAVKEHKQKQEAASTDDSPSMFANYTGYFDWMKKMHSGDDDS